MTEHAIVIVGGGPTGLMLAGELALAGVDVVIVERRRDNSLAGSRAGGLHPRAIEVLDQRGIAERFVSQGQTHPFVHFQVPIDISDLPTRHNYTLALWQNHIERILAEWVDELDVTIHRGTEAVAIAQDDTGVDVALSDGRSLRAEYLVGCDGGRSMVRKAVGIDFPGWDPTTSWLIAEVETADEPKWGFHENAFGIHAIGKGDDGTTRIVLTEPELELGTEPTLDDLRETLVAVYGTDFGVRRPTWLSRFTDMTRQAAAYRKGRVLLAGDAAHVHPPIGGQGLNMGLQDAVNLGWKLAQVVERTSADSLLDTYHAERHPVAARVLRNTMAAVALRRTDERTRALGEYVAEFLAMDEPRRRMAAEMTGLAVRYDLGDGHPLLGRRMPDLDVVTADGTCRVYTLLHDARPVLLDLGEPGSLDVTRWAQRVRWVEARYEGVVELPVLGAVTPPPAVLIRPDGYVAWAGERGQDGLAEALRTWCGSPAAA